MGWSVLSVWIQLNKFNKEVCGCSSSSGECSEVRRLRGQRSRQRLSGSEALMRLNPAVHSPNSFTTSFITWAHTGCASPTARWSQLHRYVLTAPGAELRSLKSTWRSSDVCQWIDSERGLSAPPCFCSGLFSTSLSLWDESTEEPPPARGSAHQQPPTQLRVDKRLEQRPDRPGPVISADVPAPQQLLWQPESFAISLQ